MAVDPDLESFAKAYTIPLDNERDHRVLAWLRSTVGDDAIRDAIGRLAGRRRPFVSNLCRVLGVEVPPEVIEPSKAVLSREEALKRLAEARAVVSRPVPDWRDWQRRD